MARRWAPAEDAGLRLQRHLHRSVYWIICSVRLQADLRCPAKAGHYVRGRYAEALDCPDRRRTGCAVAVAENARADSAVEQRRDGAGPESAASRSGRAR